ncbi:MAG: 6-bladed beta-propeller [Muribaculaceae bacterium]|nr:6-bladed beta-propeller [Muribaculaceae bacterium]
MYKTSYFSVLLLVLIGLSLLNCRKNDSISKKIETINIIATSDNIPYSDFISVIDSISIINEDNFYFSTIEDICISDSSLFFLDATSNLVKVNLSSGRIEQKINLSGHSDAECVTPKAVTCAEDNVFVLDLNGNKILTLDSNLKYLNSIPTHVSAVDFAIIPEGFLLFNLNCGEGDDLVLSIDRNGNILNHFIASDGIPELIISQHIFTEATDGIVIVPPLQNKLFRYDFQTANVSYTYDYEFNLPNTNGNKSAETLPLPNTVIKAFESERYIIAEFFAGQFISTSIYDKTDRHSSSGTIKTGIPYPFSPMALKDNILYGIYDKDPFSGDVKGHIIIKYYLKTDK